VSLKTRNNDLEQRQSGPENEFIYFRLGFRQIEISIGIIYNLPWKSSLSMWLRGKTKVSPTSHFEQISYMEYIFLDLYNWIHNSVGTNLSFCASNHIRGILQTKHFVKSKLGLRSF
jgi:hypothetical protein